MTAMRAKNDVVRSQLRAHPDGDRLLTDVCVTGAMDQPALVRPSQLLLATADEEHLAIQ
jgi:hypothetical protein